MIQYSVGNNVYEFKHTKVGDYLNLQLFVNNEQIARQNIPILNNNDEPRGDFPENKNLALNSLKDIPEHDKTYLHSLQNTIVELYNSGYYGDAAEHEFGNLVKNEVEMLKLPFDIKDTSSFSHKVKRFFGFE